MFASCSRPSAEGSSVEINVSFLLYCRLHSAHFAADTSSKNNNNNNNDNWGRRHSGRSDGDKSGEGRVTGVVPVS